MTDKISQKTNAKNTKDPARINQSDIVPKEAGLNQSAMNITNNNSKIVKKTIVIALAIVVLYLGFVAVGVYGFVWKTPAVDSVAKTLRYPIIFVNSSPISYTVYREDTETLSYYYSKQEELNPELFPMPETTEIEGVVLTKLIRDKMTNQIATKQGVSVSQTDVDAEFDSVSEQSGDLADVEKNIRELYNWDAATFKEKVIRPYLVRTKLQEKISEDQELNNDVRELAEAVLARVKDGDGSEPFEQVAEQYSQDESTASNGGDLGYFGLGEMVESFEQAVISLEEGEISDVVKTAYGYHIIKLEEKVLDENDVPTFRARHILIRTKTVDDFINDELAQTSVWLLAKDYSWDKANSTVISKDSPTT
ncbi:MAG: peptidylprolyl isomerase [bacterium]